MRTSLIILAAGWLAATPALADGDRYPPVTDAATLKECGACHMAFQPQLLPARSWTAIMAGLDRHFGEDASLAPDAARPIEAYLVHNAADSGRSRRSRMMRGVADDWTPMRITELPRWVREHNEEVPARAWTAKDVGSKANCPACHKRAHQGDYDDD